MPLPNHVNDFFSAIQLRHITDYWILLVGFSLSKMLVIPHIYFCVKRFIEAPLKLVSPQRRNKSNDEQFLYLKNSVTPKV